MSQKNKAVELLVWVCGWVPMYVSAFNDDLIVLITVQFNPSLAFFFFSNFQYTV